VTRHISLLQTTDNTSTPHG